jgi:Fe2+ transport system protein FeoA
MEISGTLDRLRPGQQAEITRIDAPAAERTRLMALGFVPGAPVRALLESPWGDPVAYEVCGAVIALRRTDARRILVKGK